VRATKAYILLGVAVILATASLFIVVPAPIYFLWLVSLLATELAPQIVLVSMILLWLAYRYWRLGLPRRVCCAAALLAIFSLIVGVSLAVNIFGFAASKKESLSLLDCLIFKRPQTKGIVKYKGKQYARRDSGALYLDIYQSQQTQQAEQTIPAAAAAAAAAAVGRPAIIVIHGGSWRGGHRSDFEQYDFWLAGLGYTVFDLDYRLVKSGVHFPSPEKDIELAFDWIAAHATELGVDTRRIAVLGRSAGAQLAMVMAYKAALSGDSRVRCVVDLYGPTDLAWDYDNPIQPDVIDCRDVLEAYLGGSPTQLPELYSQGSACALVGDATPPTLFIHGGHDQIVSDRNVDRLLPHLREHKIASDYLFMPWANHGYDWNFSGFSSQLARNSIERFLKKHL